MKALKIDNQQVTLVDQVENRLLRYFKDNNMKKGDSIPKENELAEALGVARGVLREALSRLKMMGLIETRTRRGMVLSEPKILVGLERVMNPNILSDETLFDLLGFRVAIEVGICKQVIDNLTPAFLKEMEYIVNDGVVFENNMYTPVSEYEFHSKLFEITGNKTIVDFQAIIRPVSLFIKEKFSDLIEAINKELNLNGGIVTHKDLLNFLKKHDKTGFQEAMERHFLPYYILMQNKNHER